MEPPFLEIVTEIAVSPVQSALLLLLPKRVDDVYVEEKGLLSPITYTGHGSLPPPLSLLVYYSKSPPLTKFAPPLEASWLQSKMSTKVHDNAEDEAFDEIDFVLASAKAGMHRARCISRKSRRNINLSDIPENFAHVPAPPSARPATEYSTAACFVVPADQITTTLSSSSPSQKQQQQQQEEEDDVHFAIRAPGVQLKRSQQKQLLGLMAAMRWLRDRYLLGCMHPTGFGEACENLGINADVDDPKHHNAPAPRIADSRPLSALYTR